MFRLNCMIEQWPWGIVGNDSLVGRMYQEAYDRQIKEAPKIRKI